MDERLFINLSPGHTYLDRLTGKTKVRLFFAFIILLIATWDIRIIFPTLLVTIFGLFSLRAKLKSVKAITIFVVLTNLLNLFLIWVVSPDYGATICGGSTVLFRFSSFYVVTAETLWYFLVRFCKLMATFLAAMTFIQCITPSAKKDKPVDLYRDNRGLKIAHEDLQAFSDAAERSFRSLAQRYYLELKGAPRVTVGKDSITVKFNIDKG